MNDGVSLVVPSFNSEATLLRAVSSALGSKGLRELIIVDDQSTDRSLAIALDLAAQDGRIRVLQASNNMGPGAARNLGANSAQGQYLSFLDADDEILGVFFADALAMISRTPDMKAVKGDMEFFDPVKGYILPDFDPRYSSAILSSSCGLVIERTAFFNIGGFPQTPAFRGPLGGEDVAFMEMVIAHLQPIGRVGRMCYRVWSQAGSHLDKFLANTRIKGESFEFVKLHPDQEPDGALARALREYQEGVAARMGRST